MKLVQMRNSVMFPRLVGSFFLFHHTRVSSTWLLPANTHFFPGSFCSSSRVVTRSPCPSPSVIRAATEQCLRGLPRGFHFTTTHLHLQKTLSTLSHRLPVPSQHLQPPTSPTPAALLRRWRGSGGVFLCFCSSRASSPRVAELGRTIRLEHDHLIVTGSAGLLCITRSTVKLQSRLDAVIQQIL